MTAAMSETGQPPHTIREAAQFYANNGFLVFPAPQGEKKSHKSKKNGGTRWGATSDVHEVIRDWDFWPDANIGLPTGSETGFFVIEADTLEGHDVDGIASLAELQTKFGPLPETLIARSPSGSMHYYFKNPEDCIIKNSASAIAPGVDVRGEGGMVIAPPSYKPSKGAYTWVNWCAIAVAPEWLVTLCKNVRKLRAVKAVEIPIIASPEKVMAAINVIANEDFGWEDWNRIAMAIYSATSGSDAGFEAFDAWSQKSSKYNQLGTKERWEKLHTSPPDQIGAGTLFYLADQAAPAWRGELGDAAEGVNIDDFAAYMEMHQYIFIPTRALWPAISVNARIYPVKQWNADSSPLLDSKGKQKAIPASTWIDQNNPVEQMTWAPGEPLFIVDKLVSEGGWFPRKGVSCFNLYRPPNLQLGDANSVDLWLDHIYNVYPLDAEHLISWCAHRVQRPHEKINHALFLGGEQGIGKDTILEPVKRAIGPWNFIEISPKDLASSFTGYLKSVILRVNEAHDLGEISRYQFYERMKTFSAAPPDVHRVNEKFMKEHYVTNCNGVVITSNHKTDGIYLPPDDRRTYVAWSELTKESFDEEYWPRIWNWYDAGGDKNVAAYLATLDISEFSAKAPPPKTEAFWAIVNSNVAPEESELVDLLDHLNNPNAITLEMLINVSEFSEIGQWLVDRKNRRAIPHKFLNCGYEPFRNKSDRQGLWKIEGRRYAIYVRQGITMTDKLAAVSTIIGRRA